MTILRTVLRVILLGAVTLLCYLLWLAGLPLAWASGRLERWGCWVQGAWSRRVARIVGMRVRVDGVPPRAPFFLVSNHVSYMDIIALASLVDCCFVAKAEIRDWPVAGWLCRAAGTLFVDREAKRDLPRVARQIEERLQRVDGVVLFPEGTSTAGDRVLPFRPSLLAPLSAAGFPVSYASIHYRTPPEAVPAHLSVCWWGDMPFLGHFMQLVRVPRIDARITFGAERVRDPDRKQLAERLWKAVHGQFTPVIELEEACPVGSI